MTIGTVQLSLQHLVGEGLCELRAGVGMASEALFILCNGGSGLGWRVHAVATEADHLPFAMTGTNASNLAGAVLVAAETDSFASCRRKLAGIANLRRIGRFGMFCGIAMAGIATLFRVRVIVTSEGLDNIFVAGAARFPLGALRTGRERDKQHRH